MRRRAAGGTNSSVRMLCRRSASLISRTRTSSAIASSSLRRFSACLASRDTSSSRFSLVRPSTSAPISWPNTWSISARVASVSSMVSCSSAATMVASSSLRSVRIAATSSGCEKYGIAGGAGLGAVRLHGVDIGAVQQVLVGVRVVGPDAFDQVVLPHHARARRFDRLGRPRATAPPRRPNRSRPASAGSCGANTPSNHCLVRTAGRSPRLCHSVHTPADTAAFCGGETRDFRASRTQCNAKPAVLPINSKTAAAE